MPLLQERNNDCAHEGDASTHQRYYYANEKSEIIGVWRKSGSRVPYVEKQYRNLLVALGPKPACSAQVALCTNMIQRNKERVQKDQ
jgi:hypothetical protein